MKKKEAFKFFNKKINVETYSEIYKKNNFSKSYPANRARLNIFTSLLKKIKPKKIIDAGCGAGMPLIEIKKKGFNITGYDKSKEMVAMAKRNLEEFNLNSNIIFQDDFENPKKIKKNSVDCIIGMGAFYYSKNIERTLLMQSKKLKKNGRLIFSLRNKLFNISTMNDYSRSFFSELYQINKKSLKVKKQFNNFFKGYIERKKFKLKNIDDYTVFSRSHNPLNVQKELLDKINCSLRGLYFYHFHYLPPVYENYEPKKFRRESWKLEKPEDPRGYFLASGFVVDSIKKG